MKVSSDAEAIAAINDSQYGLTASIWSADPDATGEIASALDVGTVFQNRCDYLDPALAWVGVKASGRGVTLSSLGYHALTRPQSLHFRTKLPGA
jgi:acyl-CoA reductase-like NAD-dependent aldehyde dehydrogenase